MKKRFVRTNSEYFENNVNKDEYVNSIVFIEDALQIWTNNKYYAKNVDWLNVLNNPIQTEGNGNKFLSDDGTYKSITIPETPSLETKTKLSEFENDCNFVSLETVQLMIQEALKTFILTDTPDEPSEPEQPTENIGVVTDDNSIIIDETQLENGTYTLRYIDSNDNIIDNFNEITSFEINK